jgi:hypothetical protein
MVNGFTIAGQIIIFLLLAKFSRINNDKVSHIIPYILIFRCGGVYKVTEKQLEKDISIIQCNGCSLFIRILYQEEFETV